MSNIFEVKDPRGRQVVCTEDRWNNHILHSRPWMEGWEEDVAKVIERPIIGIYRDADFEDREVYYGVNEGRKDRYLKVIVVFEGEEEGRVITAFPTSSPKPGEKLIWPESNR